MVKKLFLEISIILIAVFALTSCALKAAAGGEVYYLNFKPEVADLYAKIGEAYQKETGVTLKVVTAASGTYEQTLKSEIAKADAPVLFQINGPRGYANWVDYCADLKDTELYKHLSDKILAVTVGDGVYGIPYVVEGYGIIYNNAIMAKYFAMDGAKAKSMEEINNFAMLKAVVEDMTAKKDQLGIKGVFSATSLKPGEDWRWQTHLANVPIFYEVRDNNVDSIKAWIPPLRKSNSNMRITTRTSLTFISTTPPQLRNCLEAKAWMIPWRSSLWASPRWSRMETGHGVKFQELPAILSKLRMSNSCRSILECPEKRNSPSVLALRTSSRSTSRPLRKNRNLPQTSSIGCTAAPPAKLSLPMT